MVESAARTSNSSSEMLEDKIVYASLIIGEAPLLFLLVSVLLIPLSNILGNVCNSEQIVLDSTVIVLFILAMQTLYVVNKRKTPAYAAYLARYFDGGARTKLLQKRKLVTQPTDLIDYFGMHISAVERYMKRTSKGLFDEVLREHLKEVSGFFPVNPDFSKLKHGIRLGLIVRSTSTSGKTSWSTFYEYSKSYLRSFDSRILRSENCLSS
jgi:hypothetical protein